MDIRKSIEIDRPPSVVWRWLVEPERMKRWMKGLLAVEPLDKGAPRAGFRSRLTIKEGLKVSVYDEVILEIDPPRRVRSRLTGGGFPAGMEMVVGWEVEDGGRGSRVTGVSECAVKGFWMRLMSGLFRVFASLQLKGFLKRLKVLVEAES